ncbi:hypothetical protein [Ancylobacter sp. IITR112]|uniref:hypothetical protein n=1 Tax=Ancylobacter sp. IITR112 TaxID=3138073 RepID=UPI00352A49D5
MMDVLADLGPYTIPILALVGLIVLAGLVVWFGRLARRNRSQGMVAGHRLAVIDHIQIDENRRLVLIQRDDIQHLVVLGGGSDFLVESGIPAIHARAPQHPPMTARGADHARTAEPPRASAPLLHEAPRSSEVARSGEPVRSVEPVRTAETLPVDTTPRFDPARPGEGYRATPPRGEPLREPRPSRDLPPLPPAAPRAPRPAPSSAEARMPLEPRPPMISRGPARDIGTDAAPQPYTPAAPAGPVSGPPFARRPLEPRVPELAEGTRTPSPPGASPHAPAAAPAVHRAEPASAAPSDQDTGARVAVKVDPLFAGMAEHLEEALRRPAVPEVEPVRPMGPTSAIGSPAFERALEKAIDRPARPAAPNPAAPHPTTAAAHVAMPAQASVPAQIVPPTPAVSSVAATAPLVEAAPAVKPPLAPSRAPASGPQPEAGGEETSSAAPTPPLRAIDMFAPEIRLDEADTARPGAEADLFEEEMASLLGRNRRP